MNELQKKNIKKIDKSYRAPELINLGSVLIETKGTNSGPVPDVGTSLPDYTGIGKVNPGDPWSNQ